MIRLALLAALALAACDTPAPRGPVEGQVARDKVDAATKVYADCIDTTTKRLATPLVQAADAASAAFRQCATSRAALIAEVAHFRRLGTPNESADNNAAVAEASVAVIDTDLRAQAVVTAVSTKLAQEKGQ